MVPTGIYLEIPSGYEGQVRPRSGLAAKSGITVLNSPGTIDADYRGEVKVILINLGNDDFVIKPAHGSGGEGILVVSGHSKNKFRKINGILIDDDEINVKSTIQSILSDIRNAVDKPIVAARFHNTIAQMGLELSRKIKLKTGIDQIVLSGGVWQNHFLLTKMITLLEQNGFNALVHKQTPPNDGCVAFGQALITSYRYFSEVD